MGKRTKKKSKGATGWDLERFDGQQNQGKQNKHRFGRNPSTVSKSMNPKKKRR